MFKHPKNVTHVEYMFTNVHFICVDPCVGKSVKIHVFVCVRACVRDRKSV